LSLTIDRIEDSFKHLKEEAKQTEKNFIKMQEVITEKKAIFSSTPNIFPVKGWISAGYGWRTNPFTGRKEMHEAIDIVAPWGTPVKATCEGKVSYAGWKDFYGLMIKIENAYGYSIVYAHLSKILVRKGDRVEKGQVIGRVGSSGRSTGPHLHYEVWKEGKTINPLKLIVEPLE
ncbi:M23 family metallopeptidase, partial [Candidatus Aerophobetes bacterium]|nr:M23 family metallopeptidase [Candidatus Aerophobetes bacterium]